MPEIKRGERVFLVESDTVGQFTLNGADGSSTLLFDQEGAAAIVKFLHREGLGDARAVELEVVKEIAEIYPSRPTGPTQ